MHKSFYSHVNYSVTKILHNLIEDNHWFYSHVNYSVTKINPRILLLCHEFTVT